MKGVCCICRKSRGAGRPASTRVVASFRLQHYGLCPACQGRTQADISRVYGPVSSTLGGSISPPENGAGR